MSHAENLRLTAAAHVAKALALLPPEDWPAVQREAVRMAAEHLPPRPILFTMTEEQQHALQAFAYLFRDLMRCRGCGHGSHKGHCTTIFNAQRCHCGEPERQEESR